MWLRSEGKNLSLCLGIGSTVVVGGLAAWLVGAGNPGNMGLCGACFLRDVAGSLQLFAGKGPRIFRPELLGLVLGALLMRIGSRRFEARSGSHAAARFTFGVLMAFGALVFLGCPFRLFQRLGGGDLNALVGGLGLIAGTGIGLFFESKRGYTVGRSQPTTAVVGLLGPFLFLVVAALYFESDVLTGPGPGETGPPAHAAWQTSLLISAVAGVLLSASGFCGIAACRQVFQRGRKGMLLAALGLIAAYAAVSAIGGRLHAGFDGQPIAHKEHLWNFLSMALVGICGVLAGGCPVRQVVMTGEGHGDAFVTTAGLLIGGALAQGMEIASSGEGTTSAGRTTVVLGLVFALVYAFAATTKPRSA